MKRSYIIFCLLLLPIIFGCAEQKAPVAAGDQIIGLIEQQLEGLNREYLAERWKLLTTGRSDSLEIYRKALAGYNFDFEKLKKIRALSSAVTDELLKRKIDILYRMMVWQYIESHPDVRKEKAAVNNLLSDTEQDNVLINSTNNDRLINCFLYNKADLKTKKDEIFDILARLARLRNQIAGELGYNSYYSLRIFADNLEHISPDTLYSRLETASLNNYTVLANSLAKEGGYSAGVSAFGNERMYLRFRLGQALPADSLLFKTELTLKDIGFDINKLPIYVQSAATIFDKFRTECLPVFIPNDIRLVTGSESGFENFSTLFDQMGMALYSTHINQDDWLFRYSANSVWPDVVSGLMGDIIDEEIWWRNYTSLAEADIDRFQQQKGFASVLSLRINLMLAEFERLLYLQPAEKAQAIYEKSFEKYMKYQPTDYNLCRLACLKIADNPFEFRRQIIARLIVAQIIEYWRRDNETPVKNEAFKYYLVQNYFRFGQREHWNHILKWATGEELNINHFLKLNDFPETDEL